MEKYAAKYETEPKKKHNVVLIDASTIEEALTILDKIEIPKEFGKFLKIDEVKFVDPYWLITI
jgi:hypothetical protein